MEQTTPCTSIFEHLSNEIIYVIFEYLDYYHVYVGFVDLNKRFQDLLLHSTVPIKINTTTVSKSKFDRHYENFIIPNMHRINILCLSNPFTVDIVLSPLRIISNFIRLETLILDNISAKNLDQIFVELIFLPNLHLLVFHPAEYVQNPVDIFSKIIPLTKLKYCKITYKMYEMRSDQNPLPDFSEYGYSQVEHLIIDACFSHDSLKNLFYRFPKLRRLSINYLIGPPYKDSESCPGRLLKDLKHVSLKLFLINFNEFKKIVQNFFGHVEVLRISTQGDRPYLDAKQWEDLITAYIPNLRVFDIHHDGFASEDELTYHDVIDRFTSPFWIAKQWVFTHQHNWRERLNCGIFYSIQPYRRKDFTFHWQLDQQICSYVEATSYNSVKHVLIGSTKANKNPTNYFPNATELTIKTCLETHDQDLPEVLNRIVPLHQLTILTIKKFDLHLDKFIDLLCYTPNLKIFNTDSLHIDCTNTDAIKTTGPYKLALRTNKIKKLAIVHNCTSNLIPVIVNLFSQIEDLKLGLEVNEFQPIVEHLFLNKHYIPCLVFICLTEVPGICFKQLIAMTLEKKILLNDCLCKFVNQDLYLWW